MKRVRVTIVALALLALAGSRADAAAWFGVKGGVNMADLSSDLITDSSMRTQFAGGAFYGFGINEQFAVQVEGLYMSKGAEGDIMVEDGDIHAATARLDYIELPVLFMAKFPAGDKLAFDLFAGPTFAFNIKSEVEIAEHGTEDLKDDTKSFEFGATIGGGLSYLLESFSIVADVRYGIGATEVYDAIEGASTDAKNRGIAILAGVSFPLGGK